MTCLGDPSLIKHLDKLRSAAPASEADEPRAHVSVTLDEAIAQAEARAMAREEGRGRDLDALRDSSPASEQAEVLAAALAVTGRLPAGGPPTPWPFVSRRR